MIVVIKDFVVGWVCGSLIHILGHHEEVGSVVLDHVVEYNQAALGVFDVSLSHNSKSIDQSFGDHDESQFGSLFSKSLSKFVNNEFDLFFDDVVVLALAHPVSVKDDAFGQPLFMGLIVFHGFETQDGDVGENILAIFLDSDIRVVLLEVVPVVAHQSDH